jgi:ABC-2 type transport system ATP-binding protein
LSLEALERDERAREPAGIPAGVWERLQELRAASGMTILLTTHYLDEADHLCERIALMHRSRLRAVGAPDELKAELGPDATLEDVFRRHTGERLEEGGDIRDVRGARRTARRLA